MVIFGWDFEKTTSYLKSAPSNLLKTKVPLKQKIPSLGSKVSFCLGTFTSEL